MPHEERMQLYRKWVRLSSDNLLEELKDAMAMHAKARKQLQARLRANRGSSSCGSFLCM